MSDSHSVETCPTDIIHASPERVWELLTNPARLDDWLGVLRYHLASVVDVLCLQARVDLLVQPGHQALDVCFCIATAEGTSGSDAMSGE